MFFSLTVPQKWNYSPADLMNEYALKNKKATFSRDRYHKALLTIQNKTYEYDHMKIIKISDFAETVTVFLKEVKKNDKIYCYTR